MIPYDLASSLVFNHVGYEVDGYPIEVGRRINLLNKFIQDINQLQSP
jgi:hypothetical protein